MWWLVLQSSLSYHAALIAFKEHLNTRAARVGFKDDHLGRWGSLFPLTNLELYCTAPVWTCMAIGVFWQTNLGTRPRPKATDYRYLDRFTEQFLPQEQERSGHALPSNSNADSLGTCSALYLGEGRVCLWHWTVCFLIAEEQKLVITGNICKYLSCSLGPEI